MMHAGAADRKFAFEKQWSFKSKKLMQETSAWGRVPVRQGRSDVKQHLWLVQNLNFHVRAIVDLTLSVRILWVRSPKICLEHPRIEHWYMSR